MFKSELKSVLVQYRRFVHLHTYIEVFFCSLQKTPQLKNPSRAQAHRAPRVQTNRLTMTRFLRPSPRSLPWGLRIGRFPRQSSRKQSKTVLRTPLRAVRRNRLLPKKSLNLKEPKRSNVNDAANGNPTSLRCVQLCHF